MSIDPQPNQSGHPFIPPAFIPTERRYTALVQLFRILRSQIEGWPKAVFEDDCYRPNIPRAPLFIMSAPAIKTVLLDQVENFPSGEVFKRVMRPVWGNGLLPSEGKSWKWQRNATSQAFRPSDMIALTPIVSNVVQTLLDKWQSNLEQSSVDIDHEMTELTFNVILNTLLSGGEDFDRTVMQEQLRGLLADISKPKLSYLLMSDAYHKNMRAATSPYSEPLRSTIKSMIGRRRAASPSGDLVDLLLQARDPETGSGLDDDLMANNILGFIMAGHETTARTLTWALFLVASHPETAARIRNEVMSVAGDKPLAPEHINRLVFTRQVIDETQRLYPQAFQLTRVAQRDCILAGEKVAAGTRIMIPIYALHRHRSHWENPDRFDPDRFAPDMPKPNRYIYMPFGAGPRICLGASFAMIEAVTILATLVRSVDFSVCAGHKVWPIARATLVPDGGMPMVVKPSH
ncbi:MAG: cytochrome P450 [Parasphingorhabdus sp.]